MDFRELRVHGVSGTPPRQMLYTDPQSEDPADDYTKLWKVPGDCYDDTVGGFHWGGLTAGSRWTAFWIFLAPFALANTAGWMLRRRWKGSVMAVRLVGLALTALFASLLTTAGISVHSWLVLQEVDGGWLQIATALLLTILFSAVVALTGWLSTQSHFNPLRGWCRWRLIFSPNKQRMQPPQRTGENECALSDAEAWDDPTTPPRSTTPIDPDSAEPLTDDSWIWAADDRLWEPHSILHRLRRAHLTVAIATVAFAVAHGGSFGAWLVWSSAVLLLVSALIVIFTTADPENGLVIRLTALLPSAGFLLAIATIITALIISPPGVGEWEDIHLLNLWIAVAYGVTALLTFVLQIDSETFTDFSSFLNTSRTTGALAIAAFFGSAMGIAFVTAVERIVAPGAGHTLADELQAQTLLANGAAWVGVWMLVMVLLLVLVATVFSLIPLNLDDAAESDVNELSEQARGLAYLRRVTGRVEGLLVVGVLVGVAAAIGLALFGCESFLACDPSSLQADEWGAVGWLAGITVLLLAVRLFLIKSSWGYGLVVVAGLVLVAGVSGFLQIEILRIELDLSSLVDASLAVAVLLPAGYFFRSVVSGIGSGEKRRQTGILWDVASFWPRYFHPFGPPAYGPNAVTQLREEVRRWSEENNSDDGESQINQSQTGSRSHHRLRLTAHSQGSLITAVCLSTMDSAEFESLEEVVTYGSPLGFIYGRLFESTDLDGLIGQVRGDNVRWVNLWRRTDYLGGRPVGEAHGIVNLEASDFGHSGYECTDEYDRGFMNG